jgi:hypothetical protein
MRGATEGAAQGAWSKGSAGAAEGGVGREAARGRRRGGGGEREKGRGIEKLTSGDPNSGDLDSKP